MPSIRREPWEDGHSKYSFFLFRIGLENRNAFVYGSLRLEHPAGAALRLCLPALIFKTCISAVKLLFGAPLASKLGKKVWSTTR